MSPAAAAAQSRSVANAPSDAIATRRFYDSSLGAWVVKVLPGEYYVTHREDEVVVTILGSCVSACIRDPLAGIGGMNHFMLPQGGSRQWNGESESTRFGNFAMEKLINELLKAGCSRSGLEIKVFGGANVTTSTNAVGTENSDFILHYLDVEGLGCAVQDLGGQLPRRIHFYPMTGRVIRRLLNNGAAGSLVTEEADYATRLSTQTTAGDIELFDQ